MRIIVFCLALLAAPAASAADTMVASWYGPNFHGSRMANGQTFDQYDPAIAAHRSLPFGTKLRLTNPENGATIEVIVSDRGPFVRGRDLDLSRAAAEKLGFINAGSATLHVEQVN